MQHHPVATWLYWELFYVAVFSVWWLDTLRGQHLKLNHAVYNSKFDEYLFHNCAFVLLQSVKKMGIFHFLSEFSENVSKYFESNLNFKIYIYSLEPYYVRNFILLNRPWFFRLGSNQREWPWKKISRSIH